MGRVGQRLGALAPTGRLVGWRARGRFPGEGLVRSRPARASGGADGSRWAPRHAARGERRVCPVAPQDGRTGAGPGAGARERRAHSASRRYRLGRGGHHGCAGPDLRVEPPGRNHFWLVRRRGPRPVAGGLDCATRDARSPYARDEPLSVHRHQYDHGPAPRTDRDVPRRPRDPGGTQCESHSGGRGPPVQQFPARHQRPKEGPDRPGAPRHPPRRCPTHRPYRQLGDRFVLRCARMLRPSLRHFRPEPQRVRAHPESLSVHPPSGRP